MYVMPLNGLETWRHINILFLSLRQARREMTNACTSCLAVVSTGYLGSSTAVLGRESQATELSHRPADIGCSMVDKWPTVSMAVQVDVDSQTDTADLIAHSYVLIKQRCRISSRVNAVNDRLPNGQTLWQNSRVSRLWAKHHNFCLAVIQT